MSRKQYPQFLLIFFILLFSGCVRGISDPTDINPTIKMAYILNEGVSGQGNSSITIYFERTGDVIQNAFLTRNGRPIGDSPSDMFISRDIGYILVKNEKKLELININTQVSLNTVDLSHIGSPSRITPDLAGRTAFITFTDTSWVSIFDIEEGVLQGGFELGVIPGGLTVAQNKLFIADWDGGTGNTVRVIDLITAAIIDTVVVGRGPIELLTDLNDNVWVLCTGSSADGIPGDLYRIEPLVHIPQRWFGFVTTASRMSYSGGLYIYVVTPEGVRRVLISQANQSTLWLAGITDHNLTGIQVNAQAGTVFISAVNPTTGAGLVNVYRSNSDFMRTIPAGIRPHRIFFVY